MIRAAVISLALAASLALAPAAVANRTVVHDPKGDTLPALRSYLDFRKAIAAHAGPGRLKHVAVMKRATANSPRAIQVHLRAGGRRYTIFGLGIGKTPVYVVDRRGATTGETTGTATIRRRGGRVIFTFPRSALGNPFGYRWRLEANPNAGIYRGRRDWVPNRGTRRHVLGGTPSGRRAALSFVARRSARRPRFRRCGNLVITRHSGNALGRIRARGISCRRARGKLRAWAKNGYRPRTGPRGYQCRVVNRPPHGTPGQRCTRVGHRLPVIAFDSGT